MLLVVPFCDALFNEFASFYGVDELPVSWDNWDLDRHAEESADRLQDWIKDEYTAELAAYLRTESQYRGGELTRQISTWTRFLWDVEDKDWAVLQRILNAIADHLDPPAP